MGAADSRKAQASPQVEPRKADSEGRRISRALSVGQSIRIKRASHEGSAVDPLSSEMLGWRTGAFLVVGHPTLNGRYANLIVGEEYLMSFLYQGVAYGFQTRLLSLQAHPVPIAFLEFPQKVESQVFRKHKRVPVRFPTRVSFRGEDGKLHEWEGLITNLSGGGCQLVGNEVMPVKTEATLRFILPGGISADQFSAVLRRLTSVNEEYVFGFEFLLQDDPAGQRLRAITHEFEQLGG